MKHNHRKLMNERHRERIRSETTDQIQDPEPMLRYPIGDTEISIQNYIDGAASLLQDSATAIYLDTSFMMWLTKGSVHSREQFISWAGSLGKRIHVPVWTFHEYFRHHQHNTLRSEIKSEADALRAAAKKFFETIENYADQSLMPGVSPEGFRRELDGLSKKIKDITGFANAWNYETAAQQLSTWMSERVCRSRVVFDLMERLDALGSARYTQDIPPGFLDRTKKDEHEKGSNRFGDLLLWEEILEHARGIKAKNVVILTRDRKHDWFARSNVPVVDERLQRLCHRWAPIPVPHPLLVLELCERTSARKLVLLDDLYLGGVLHHICKRSYNSFIAYALGITAAKYTDDFLGAETHSSRNVKRQHSETLGLQKAKEICAAAQNDPNDEVKDILNCLMGGMPTAEEFVNTFTDNSLSSHSVFTVAVFARIVADLALGVDASPAAILMYKKLITILPSAKADAAAAALVGLLTSAYFDNKKPRSVPVSYDLQGVFGNLQDPEYKSVLTWFGISLKKASSKAIFIPDGKSQKISLHFSHDSNQEQVPAVLQQIAINGQSLLVPIGSMLPSNLSLLLEKRNVASVNELSDLVAERYGLPRSLIEVTGANLDDMRTISNGIGFVDHDAIVEPSDLQVMPTDEELERQDLLEVEADEDELNESVFLDDDE